MDTKKILHMVAFTLMVVGGLNYGLVGLFGDNWDVLGNLLGDNVVLTEIIYTLIGVSTVYTLVTHPKDCKICAVK